MRKGDEEGWGKEMKKGGGGELGKMEEGMRKDGGG